MLVVMIDLLPGHPQRRHTIGSMRIANISDLANVSDCSVEVMEATNPLADTPPEDGDCKIERHDRRQSIWKLLARAASGAETANYFEL